MGAASGWRVTRAGARDGWVCYPARRAYSERTYLGEDCGMPAKEIAMSRETATGRARGEVANSAAHASQVLVEERVKSAWPVRQIRGAAWRTRAGRGNAGAGLGNGPGGHRGQRPRVRRA